MMLGRWLRRWLFVVGLGLWSVQAVGADEGFAHPRWYSQARLVEQARQLAVGEASRSCGQSYAPMFEDGRLDLSLFFGFSELTHSGVVVDPYNVRSFVDQLSRPCEGQLLACGFTLRARPKTANAAFVLQRRLLVDGQSVPVRLRLFDSAVADDYESVLARFASTQSVKTKAVEQAFLSALGEDDAVFYLGHARLGTGLSFGPFEPLSRAWWRAMLAEPMRTAVISALRQREQPLPLLGLFACETDAHYYQGLRRASPASALLVSEGTSFVDDDSQRLLVALNAVLSRSCEPGWRSVLHRGSGVTDYRLSGLFAPADDVSASPSDWDWE